MRKIKDTMDRAVIKTQMVKANAKEIVFKKAFGGKEMVIEIILLAIALFLAFVWKSGLNGVVSNMITSASGKIANLMS